MRGRILVLVKEVGYLLARKWNLRFAASALDLRPHPKSDPLGKTGKIGNTSGKML